MLAHELYLHGNLEEALTSVNASQDYASSFLVRAEILTSMGELDDARRNAERAVELCPNSPRALLLLESLGRAASVGDGTPLPEPTLSELFDEELPASAVAQAEFALDRHSSATKIDSDSNAESAISTSDPHDDDTPRLVSETLARLMVKQGKIAEARKVYIQLSRKYPERYEYFRGRMDELNGRAE